jgi:hypothetical protein
MNELNNLRYQVEKKQSSKSITEKLQDLQRRLLELSVKHYKIDGTDLV